jgi:hypothetical protein
VSKDILFSAAERSDGQMSIDGGPEMASERQTAANRLNAWKRAHQHGDVGRRGGVAKESRFDQ